MTADVPMWVGASKINNLRYRFLEKAGDCGRTPGPDWRKCTAYRRTGPGGLPLALRLSEWLGPHAAALPSADKKHAQTNLYKSIT